MTTIMYYFSGTGNSLRVANDLQRIVADSNTIGILSLRGMDIIRPKAEAIGFVFPIYCHTVPAVVKEFIAKLDLSIAKYIFAVATTDATQCRAFVEIVRDARAAASPPPPAPSPTRRAVLCPERRFRQLRSAGAGKSA